MNIEQLYQQRLRRAVTAPRNEQTAQIPIRPFGTEFVGNGAGVTFQAFKLV